MDNKTNNKNSNTANSSADNKTNNPTFLSEFDIIINENNILKEALSNLNKELERMKEPPLIIADVEKVFVEENKRRAIIRLPNGNTFYVNIPEKITLRNGDTVVCEQRNLNIIRKIEHFIEDDIEKFVIIEKPKITYNDIGGLDEQLREIKEVIELPLLHPELFERVGIDPPKGILLFGHPGTGKTLLAKAVANYTHCTFIEIVGSELVQKFIGEGAKLVDAIFELARKKAPAIIFIDEIDAIASKRIEIGTSGEREVQRTFMQLLAEIDGFKNLDNVKIIGATNRIDILDDAIIRPGRLDRLIEIDFPNEEGRLQILKIHTKKMTLDKVNLNKIAKLTPEFSGAELKAICTEAGYFAIRTKKTKVNMQNFLDAIDKIKTEAEDESHKIMFG